MHQRALTAGTLLHTTYSNLEYTESRMTEWNILDLFGTKCNKLKDILNLDHQHLVCKYILICFFQGEELLAPRPTPNLEDHPLSAVRDCLFNLFATTLHIGGRSSIRNQRTRHAVVTGTHKPVSFSRKTLLHGVSQHETTS